MIHPDEKIIFWREEQMEEFLMVCRDFIPEKTSSLVYCLLPDRMEMILFTEELIHPIDICRMFQMVTTTYLELFGSHPDYPLLIGECGWIIKELDEEVEIEENVSRLSKLPVEMHLRKEGEPWNFASFAMPEFSIPEEDSSEEMLGFVDSVLQEVFQRQQAFFSQYHWTDDKYKH